MLCIPVQVGVKLIAIYSAATVAFFTIIGVVLPKLRGLVTPMIFLYILI